MKGRVDKSKGLETLIAEALAKIKPTESLRLSKQTVKKTKWSNSPPKALVSRWASLWLLSFFHPPSTRALMVDGGWGVEVIRFLFLPETRSGRGLDRDGIYPDFLQVSSSSHHTDVQQVHDQRRKGQNLLN